MPLVVANWKMNLSVETGTNLARELLALIDVSYLTEAVLCAPFIMLEQINRVIQGSSIKLGAQDCSFAENGAHTGDISASMLKDCGCDYVIIGHSERRLYYNESNHLISKKALAALNYNLKPIICIGETDQERRDGLTFQVLERQMDEILSLHDMNANFIFAYEPVWAIGSGKTPTNDQIAETVLFIRKFLLDAFEISPTILYGGSVTPDNAANIAQIEHVGGALVGKASLITANFKKILENICKPR